VAITTYAQLQSAILYRMGNRSDAGLTARVPEFITSAEDEMQRRLKTADQEASTTLTTTADTPTVALPTGFISARRIRLLEGGVYTDLWPVSLAGDKTEYVSGRPQAVALQGSNLVVKPTPDGAYSLPMDYYAKFTALSDSNTSNWILASHQDAYVTGGLGHGFLSVGNFERGEYYLQKFFAILDDIGDFDKKKRFGQGKARTDLAWINRSSFNINTGT
jgi:hypothetical protein